MDRHVLVVLTNPVAGREDEYNDWYDNVHLRDVVAVPGFVAAQRYALQPGGEMGDGMHRYLALYEVEGDPVAAQQALTEAVATGMHISDALDMPGVLVGMFTPRGARVERVSTT